MALALSRRARDDRPRGPGRRAASSALAAAVLVMGGSAAADDGDGDGAEAADRERARELFRAGQGHAEEENWGAATDHWKRAYEAAPMPIILFSIGQAYRQQGECARALYAYERYLEEEEAGAQFIGVAEGHVESLADECEPSPWEGEDAAAVADEGDAEGEGALGGPDEGGDGEADAGAPSAGEGPRPGDPRDPATPAWERDALVLFVEIGPSMGPLGDLETSAALTAIRAGAGYPFQTGPLEVSAGAATRVTPIPVPDEGGTAMLTSVAADASVRYPIAGALSVRGGLGLGAQILSGLSDTGDVFIPEGLQATGALTMVYARAQIAAEYALSRRLALSVTPLAVSYSPAPDGLREDITSITRLEVLAGATLRL